MKKLIRLVLPMMLALTASAASLPFIKVGSTYNVYGPQLTVLTVMQDAGNGWYRCTKEDGLPVGYVNFNLVVGVLEVKFLTPALPRGPLTREEIRIAVTRNLMELQASLNQFLLDHGGFTATYDDLVGPTRYVQKLTPVDGEDYSKMKFEQGKPLSVLTMSGQIVTYVQFAQ